MNDSTEKLVAYEKTERMLYVEKKPNNVAGLFREELRKFAGATRTVLTFIVTECNHSDNPYFEFENKTFPLKRGQLITSRKTISEGTGLSEQQVRTATDNLLHLQVITKSSTGILTNRATLITVLDIDKYLYKKQADQPTDQPTELPTINQLNRQRVTTINNDTNNESKNDSKSNIYVDFIKLFNELKGSKFRGNKDVQRQFNARLKEGFTLQDFKTAIHNCLSDEYHKEHPNFLTPEFITRSDKLEKYLNYQITNNNGQTNNKGKFEFENIDKGAKYNGF